MCPFGDEENRISIFDPHAYCGKRLSVLSSRARCDHFISPFARPPNLDVWVPGTGGRKPPSFAFVDPGGYNGELDNFVRPRVGMDQGLCDSIFTVRPTAFDQWRSTSATQLGGGIS